MLETFQEIRTAILSNLPQASRNVAIEMPDQSQRHIIAASLDDLCAAIFKGKANNYQRSIIEGHLETLTLNDMVRVFNVTINNGKDTITLIERVIPAPPPVLQRPSVDLLSKWRAIQAAKAAGTYAGDTLDDEGDDDPGQNLPDSGQKSKLSLINL